MNEKDFEKLVFGMAHQIRNPCAIILSNANILLQDTHLSPNARRSLESIVHGAKYLESRLDEFVEFSKPLVLNLHEVSVYHMLHEVESFVKEKCQLKRIKISCNVDKSLLLRKADHEKLLLSLLNIVFNSIESITDGGIIAFEAQVVNDTLLIMIQDSGCGIHPRDLPEMFSPFYSTKQGGIGIGLTISKRIIEAHKGRIELASEQGKGTRMTISLPR